MQSTFERPTVRLRPITSRILRHLPARDADLRNSARERVELAPATTTRTVAALSLPNEIDRASGTMATSTLAFERRQAGSIEIRHAPTTAYRVDGGLVHDGTCYANGRLERLAPRRGRLFASGRLDSIEEAQLCIDVGASQYFGHWLIDALSTELLAQDRGLPALTVPNEGRLHESGYRELLGLHARAASCTWVDRLWIVDDRGYNKGRVDRLHRLRALARAGIGESRPPWRNVYIDRGHLGADRNLSNCDALVDVLKARGFDILRPERESPHDIARMLTTARLVVGIEGSHLNHALLAMRAGGALVAIQPPHRFNMFNNTIASFIGLRFGFVVADARANGFEVDLGRLSETLDLVERRIDP